MAGHQWDDWFEREEFIGHISDMRVQNLQVEREVVQKRTFTRWMNLHLEKCNPPIEVQDLFQDIQDGRILMALLEELSGCKLLQGFKKSSHRIFRINNITQVLSFLEERNVRLVSIDAADVVDGNTSVILGLIWNIILFFQIKELTGNIRSQFPSTSTLSSTPTSSDLSNGNTSLAGRHMAAATTREHSKAFKKLLQWVQKQTRKYGVAIQDFGKSWTSGLAFLAVIKSIDPSLVDMRRALLRSAQENLDDAFRIAHYCLGIPRLLEPEDVTTNAPDEQSIMTYVSQFLEHFPGIDEQNEPNPFIERSISVDRLGFCEPDRATLTHSIVKERCLMFQKDCPQPPPHILCSFVSEDKGNSSPSIHPTISCTWLSEDSFADSTCMKDNLNRTEENVEPPEEVISQITPNSLQLTQSHSRFDSPLLELKKTESVKDDSAISSPDSWVESDDGVVPVKCCQSLSRSSSCDWDMDCATHVHISSFDEGSVPIPCELPDDQFITDSCIDEGIFSLNSDDTQGKVLGKEIEQKDSKEVAEKEEEDFKNQSKVFFPKVILETSNENRDCQVRWTDAHHLLQVKASTEEKLPVKTTSLSGSDSQETGDATISGAHPQTEPQLCSNEELSESFSVATSPCEEQGCLKQAADRVTNSQIGEKIIDHQTDKRVEVENECYKIDCQSKQMGPNSFVKDEDGDEPLSAPCDTEKYMSAGDAHQLESDKTNQALCYNKSDLESYSHQQLEQQSSGVTCSDDKIFFKKTTDHATDSQVIERQFYCQQSLGEVNVDTFFFQRNDFKKTVCSLRDKRKEEATEKPNKSIDVDERYWPDLQVKLESNTQEGDPKIRTDQIAGCPVNTEDMSSASQAARHQNEQNEPPQKYQKIDLCNDPLGTSKEINDFSTDPSQGCDSIESLNCFYPNREEALFTEPLNTQMQSWPLVLSLSPLKPAPASETVPQDKPLYLMDEDVAKLLNEDSKVMTEIKHKTCSRSELKGLCQLPGGQITDLTKSVFPPDCSDLSEAQQNTQDPSRENTETMRDGTKIPSVIEIPIPPVLRQRRGIYFSQSNQMTVRTFSRKYKNGDSEFCWSGSWEPYLLFVLWLLLYCLWLLPQMDLKTLPSLLFNINH
ncbi:uncharacterized protein clmna isoform X2 [Hippocampus zosterae]|uniref:uncharacterized protein clmna isoform X2 n=1 Tax=Hippocampus zosterae TaxID=109293 RepID=UPI00223CE9F3|nr:uncharacterized protein clmna isoform X2 [Hippocampus zosterae]